MGGMGITKCWHLDRGLLVKKPGLANIWRGGEGGHRKVDGWQRRPGKGTKGRWQARGQHTSVKSIAARIGKKRFLVCVHCRYC